MYKHVDRGVDEGFDELEKLLSETCRVCWVNGVRVSALDDNLRMNQSAMLEIVVKNIFGRSLVAKAKHVVEDVATIKNF